MKTLTQNTQRTPESRLLAAMTEADGGQPFMTHKAAAVLGSTIITMLNGISERAEAAAQVKPEWGTVGQVAVIYGMKPARADDYLLEWAAEGKVRVITPTDPMTGKPGYKRFNLADVAACMCAPA